MKIQTGDLTDYIQLQRIQSTPDGGGGQVEVWTTYKKTWADIRPLSGFESLMAMQKDARITHDIIMRYRTDLKASDRIFYKDRIFDIIQAPINYEEKSVWLVIRCEEKV